MKGKPHLQVELPGVNMPQNVIGGVSREVEMACSRI